MNQMCKPSEIEISVVMITYNHELYIAEAIEGVLNQSFGGHVELIISDDFSTDNTESIVQHYCKTHPKGNLIRYTRHAQNLGMMNNFIWALKQSKGHFVAICEGDDFWSDKDKLKDQLGLLSANSKLSFVCNNIYHVNQNGEVLVDNWPNIDHVYNMNFRLIGDEYPVATNTLFIRGVYLKEILKLLQKMIKPDVLGDYALISFLLSKGSGLYSPKKVAAYRHHDESNFSSNSMKEKIRRGILTRKFLRIYWNKHGNWMLSLILTKNLYKYKKRYWQ